MTAEAVQAKVGSAREKSKQINDASLEEDFCHYSKFQPPRRMRRYFLIIFNKMDISFYHSNQVLLTVKRAALCVMIQASKCAQCGVKK